MTPAKLKHLSIHEILEGPEHGLIQLRVDHSCEQLWLEVFAQKGSEEGLTAQTAQDHVQSRSVMMLLPRDYFRARHSGLNLDHAVQQASLFEVRSALDLRLLSVSHEVSPIQTKADLSKLLKPALERVLLESKYPF